MKKKYTAPTAKVEEFDLKDVVMATSGDPAPKSKMLSSRQVTRIEDDVDE